MIRTLLFVALASLSAILPTQGRAQDPWFTTEALNPGLGAAPATADRRTPRATIETFLRSADRGDWATAAQILDLTDLPEASQMYEGPDLAERLHSIIDRNALLDWGLLLDRPDALQVLGGQQQAMAGQPRRSLLLRELALPYAPASIRLNRIRPGEDAEPVWVFSRETVADVPAMFDVYGPSRFERGLPQILRADAFWGLMWWEIVGLPLLVIAAVALGFAVHRVLRALSRRASGDLARRILAAVSTPAIVASVTTLVWIVTRNLFAFSGQIDIFLSPAIAIGFVTATLMLIVNGIGAALDHLIAPDDGADLAHSGDDSARGLATRLNAAKRILIVVVVLVGAGVVLSTAEVFRGFGVSLLASAGALTLVLGFAARDVLANVMASLQIALNQSARVGDRVVWRGYLCHVERINMTFVQLRDWDGTRVIVPVTEFVAETFENWTLSERAMLRIVKFKLSPLADLEALRAAFTDILDDIGQGDLAPEMGDPAKASVKVTGQDVLGLDVWFSVPCADPNTSWEVACTARERIVAAACRIATDDRPVFPEAVAAEAA